MNGRTIKDALRMMTVKCGKHVDNCNVCHLAVHSNSVKKGSLFVGIKGRYVNGGIFAPQAILQGATCCVVDQDAASSLSDDTLERCIIVKNTEDVLMELAIRARCQFHNKVIGITGSIGKTTTKEMLKGALAYERYTNYGEGDEAYESKIFATYGNQNGKIGVPLSVFNMSTMEPHAELAILEMGISNEDEMGSLTSLVKPDIAIITNISPVHIGSLKGIERIAHVKSEIFNSMQPGQFAVLNRDIAQYDILHNHALCKQLQVITFGVHATANVRLIQCSADNMYGASIVVKCFGKRIHYVLSTAGKSFIYASLITLAIAMICGADIVKCAIGMGKVEALEGRGKIYTLHDGINVIDDSYSSNPTALLAALERADTIRKKNGGRLIVVLGDMMELGEYTKDFHMAIGEQLQEVCVDLLFSVGPEMCHIRDKLFQTLNGKGFYGTEELLLYIEKNLRHELMQNDTILIKGSHSWALDTVVNKILEVVKTVC